MSEPIKAGDLVVVVRGHECDIGEIFRVFAVGNSHQGWWTCLKCFAKWHSGPNVWADRGDGLGAQLRNLKRIPPIAELEGEKQKEDIREPA